MAFRIHESVVRGEIENTSRGTVKGRIWLKGRDEPLTLELAGNCWRDLAGRRCTFENPNPVETRDNDLASQQSGEVGDITASRKVRVPDLPVAEWLDAKRKGLDAPEHWDNALYLEWYSDANGRVVVESVDYQLTVSLPEWEMTEEEERRQREFNAEAMHRFMNRLEAALRPDQPVEVPEDRDMDEFEWERFLQQCDARTERFGELMEKYEDDPDRKRIVARHMGWDHMIEMLDAEARGELPATEEPCDELEEEWDEPEPDPATEGVDWIRTEDGRTCHPLQNRCFELAVRMFRDAEDAGLLGRNAAEPDDSVDLMKFKISSASAKLAGALNGLGQGVPFECGFIVASLKRALAIINEALGAMNQVEQDGTMPDLLPEYRRETLEIRAGIIDCMDRFRNRS